MKEVMNVAFERMLNKEIVPIDNIIKKHMIREAIQNNVDTIITPVGVEASFYDCFTSDKLSDNNYISVFYYNIGHDTYSVVRRLITKNEEVSSLCLSSLVNF